MATERQVARWRKQYNAAVAKGQRHQQQVWDAEREFNEAKDLLAEAGALTEDEKTSDLRDFLC